MAFPSAKSLKSVVGFLGLRLAAFRLKISLCEWSKSNENPGKSAKNAV
jgi:hypothetical protein